jgi:LacI family transcriptional regulator
MNAAIAQLFALEDAPTALFIVDGTHLLPTLHALMLNRIALPDDVSLVSYDDRPEALDYHVPITTVRQPLDRAAEVLLEEARARMERRPGKAVTVLQPELTVRKSCRTCGRLPGGIRRTLAK